MSFLRGMTPNYWKSLEYITDQQNIKIKWTMAAPWLSLVLFGERDANSGRR